MNTYVHLTGFCTYVVLVDTALLWCMSMHTPLVFIQTLFSPLCLLSVVYIEGVQIELFIHGRLDQTRLRFSAPP